MLRYIILSFLLISNLYLFAQDNSCNESSISDDNKTHDPKKPQKGDRSLSFFYKEPTNIDRDFYLSENIDLHSVWNEIYSLAIYNNDINLINIIFSSAISPNFTEN